MCSMKMFQEACYLYLTLIVLVDKVDTLTCGFKNITVIKTESAGSFANISSIVSVGDAFDVTVIFEMCRNDFLEPGCKFLWKNQSREMTVRNTGEAMLCSWKSRDHSQTFKLHVSYLVQRSVSMVMLSATTKGSEPELLEIMGVIATYPPKVTNLTVEEQEVSGNHLINEGEQVKVACSFDEGNPPTVFRLMDKNGKNLASGQRRLIYSLSAQCEDDWPRVDCEGNGSKQNRSVSFLIRCPIQFPNNLKVVSPSTPGIITLRVKAHTKVVKECYLTPMSADNTTRSVNCALKGSPPDLNLSLYVGEEKDIRKGVWMVQVCNEEGSTNTTFALITATNSRAMACTVQHSSPIKLKFIFPENGCRKDFAIYYHFADGQQKSVFSCDWLEREQTYDCDSREQGVTWDKPGSSHTIITLPGNFEQSTGYFRYQISCHDESVWQKCSLAPVDEKTVDPTMRVENVNTATMGTDYTRQQDSNPFGSQAFMGLVAGNAAVIVIMSILMLLLIIATILLYKICKFLKGASKEINTKLLKFYSFEICASKELLEFPNNGGGEGKRENIMRNSDIKNRADSETEQKPSAEFSMEDESNAKSRTKVESVVSRTSELDTEMDTYAENRSPASDSRKRLMKKGEGSRVNSETEAEQRVSLLPRELALMERQMKTLLQFISTQDKDRLTEPDSGASFDALSLSTSTWTANSGMPDSREPFADSED